jgi:D-beta-D-heptose 7-phosphate kinase/D-beta-D-heptose 1-phosphate adenosyltransferase
MKPKRMKARDKIRTLDEIARIARRARAAGRTVVTTNGCFDLLHVGHIRNLEAAKARGDLLIVGVNSDASVRTYKEPMRPVVPARERAEVLAALAAVDYVFTFNDTVPNRWLRKLRPNIHVKGSDRALADIVERHVVADIGGKLVLLPVFKGHSTTALIARIRRSARAGVPAPSPGNRSSRTPRSRARYRTPARNR